MELKRAKIRDIRKALDTKEISAAELCGEYFKRIEAFDPQLLSYITVTKEKAVKDAENAQKLIDAGKSAPLTGIPLAIKDNICIDGVRTTCASKMLENFIPPYNATVIEKLNEQGYVLLGRASMDEFAMGGSTQTSAFAKTKNPYDLERVPGGSSGGSAAAVGAVIGCIVGTWLFPKVIWIGYGIMYSMGEIEYYFDLPLSLLSMAVSLLCSMGAAYFSCRHELLSVPANLIRPKAPKSGKRIFLEKIPFIWGRMKFLHKVSVRNIIRYKKRFFMMILGISGCTALLVTGFGIKDSVMNIAEMQYDEIQVYDIDITFSEGVTEKESDELAEQTGDLLKEIGYRYEKSVDLSFGGRIKSVYLEIPKDSGQIGTFLRLHTEDGVEIPWPKEGEAVLSAKIAENLGIKVGDEVILQDSDRNSLSVRVTALCENFVYNYIYVDKETYQTQTGSEPEYKSAFALAREGADVHEAAAAIADRKNVLAVSVIADMRARIANMMESMNYIVALIIICAGSLAFIVLYNLTNINITERIREIATIKVLGFYARETADYVFRENLMLTFLGALVGLGLGKWLHWFVMYNINIDMISFKTLITPASYLLSLLFTFIFAMLVNGFMYFKLEKINMAESLKSIE